ncbi:MAG: hypothetical protein Tsb0027_10060 [Wenzhouxiangellaceae bacterium]
MLNEAAEQRRRHYLQLLDIDIYPATVEPVLPAPRPSAEAAACSPARQVASRPDAATVRSPEPDAAATQAAPAPARTQTAVTAASAAQASPDSHSHECLLLCTPAQRELPLLLDILRHIPALANADDDFLHSHMVSARQLAALRPRMLLTINGSGDETASGSCEQHLDIDLQGMQSEPSAAKQRLWQQLQTLVDAGRKPG